MLIFECIFEVGSIVDTARGVVAEAGRTLSLATASAAALCPAQLQLLLLRTEGLFLLLGALVMTVQVLLLQ